MVRNVSFLHLGFLFVRHLLSSLQAPVELVDGELLPGNRRLNCLVATLERGLPHEQDLLRAALAEDKELVPFLVRIE